MKSICLLAAIFLMAFSPIVQHDGFKPFLQLTGGTWKVHTPNGFSCQQWKKTNETELLGRGFIVNGKNTTIQDQAQLTMKDGYIFYIPTLTQKGESNVVDPAPFKLTSAYNGTYMFISDRNDYPQIITYQFIGKDSLIARTDGNFEGKRKRVDLHYKRVN